MTGSENHVNMSFKQDSLLQDDTCNFMMGYVKLVGSIDTHQLHSFVPE